MSRSGPLLVSLLEIGPGSTHGEGELGSGIEESRGFGFWRGGGVEDFWRVSNLEPGNLTGWTKVCAESISMAPVQCIHHWIPSRSEKTHHCR